MFAEIALNSPVAATFDYHIPPELDGLIEPGHLVQVPFRTALEYGVVLATFDDDLDFQTKPVLERLDPRPLLTWHQIELAWWLSEAYHAPIGLCVWLLLPPGITGGRDVLVRLTGADVTPADDTEAAVIALLQRRGDLRGAQISNALPGKKWRPAVDALVKAGAVETMSILRPPRVKPKKIDVAALAIHPGDIEQAVEALARPSRPAAVLDALLTGETVERKSANRDAIEKLVTDGSVRLEADETVTLLLSPDAATERIRDYRRLTVPLHVLRLLAREGDAIDVSWIYAQTGAKLADLKKLDEADLITLGERPTWRDSLADRDFAATTPPPLTTAQVAAWARVRSALDAVLGGEGPGDGSTPPPERLTPPPDNARGEGLGDGSTPPRERLTPPPAPPRIRGGELRGAASENYRVWRSDAALWFKLKGVGREMRQEPTAAERRLWEHLRDKRLDGHKFRRQHVIDRFIVDFYCHTEKLIIEIDGDIHLLTEEEDALRQEHLEQLGFRVIRFTNDQVFHEIESVLETIRVALKASPPRIRGGERGVGSTQPERVLNPSAAETNTRFLLHGVTGSGKTEIYLRAIERTLQHGRSAILLVPEIALTAQTVRRVAGRFGGRVAIVHSGLSDGERYDTWRRARDGLVRVVVGARSALFTPLPDVGLVILDEEHDASYKQSPPVLPPYYHARDVAAWLMRYYSGVLILGSATPDLETMYRARQGALELLELPYRVMGHRDARGDEADSDAVLIDLPPVQVVDMRRELKSGNTSMFSRRLQTALEATLKRREQAILFMNRRGQATYVFCRDCGYVAQCPNCDTPLTFHRAGEALRCHHCGHEQAPPSQCPECGSARIRYFGAGTQQIEERLHVLFPKARTLRWDADSASASGGHDAILQQFIDRRADILVGTQMVAKGLDLPLVTLVGVVSADVGLALPDFRAGERTFQLLTQVAGRSGRGLHSGEVVLQTYQPDHYAIAAASRHDYAEFYAREIDHRRDLGYPPFRRLVRLLFTDQSVARAEREARRAADMLRFEIKKRSLTGTEVIGPAPCFFTRLNRQYRWHVLLRGPDPAVALHDLKLPSNWYIDIDPVEVL